MASVRSESPPSSDDDDVPLSSFQPDHESNNRFNFDFDETNDDFDEDAPLAAFKKSRPAPVVSDNRGEHWSDDDHEEMVLEDVVQGSPGESNGVKTRRRKAASPEPEPIVKRTRGIHVARRLEQSHRTRYPVTEITESVPVDDVLASSGITTTQVYNAPPAMTEQSGNRSQTGMADDDVEPDDDFSLLDNSELTSRLSDRDSPIIVKEVVPQHIQDIEDSIFGGEESPLKDSDEPSTSGPGDNMICSTAKKSKINQHWKVRGCIRSARIEQEELTERHSGAGSSNNNSDLNSSDGAGPLWLAHARGLLPFEAQVVIDVDSSTNDTSSPSSKRQKRARSLLVYDPLRETDIMRFFIGQERLSFLDLNLAPKEWWDRDIDPHLVNQFKKDLMINPKLLLNSNAIPAILTATRTEYEEYLMQAGYIGGGLSFEQYFKDRIFIVGGKIRYTALTQINTEYRDFFPSLTTIYGVDLARMLFNVFIHDRRDSVRTLPEGLIIKVAASSNLENPGSCQLLLSDQVWMTRKYCNVVMKQKMPKDPHLTEVPDIRSKSREWRQMVWNAVKGATLAFSTGRGQLEPLFQFSRRPVVVMRAYYDFEDSLCKRLSEIQKNDYRRIHLLTGYQIGHDGFNNMENHQILEVFKRCKELLANPNYSFDSVNAVKKLLGVEVGIVFLCRLIKARTALIDFLIGDMAADSLSQIQEIYTGWFTRRKLEELCLEPAHRVERQRKRTRRTNLPESRVVIKDFGKGKITPFRWVAHASAAKRWLELQKKGAQADEGEEDMALRFVSDSDCDVSSVLFLTQGLHCLTRQSVLDRVGSETVAWTGFDAVIVNITLDDCSAKFGRFDQILSQLLPLRPPTHLNWLFLGDATALLSLRDYLVAKKPTISVVQLIGHMHVNPRKGVRRSEKSSETASIQKADSFTLKNPLQSYLLAHYSSSGLLTSKNMDKSKEMDSFISRSSWRKCYAQLISWITPAKGWIASFVVSESIAIACTEANRNIVFCSDDTDAVGELHQSYGQWRSQHVSIVKRRKETPVEVRKETATRSASNMGPPTVEKLQSGSRTRTGQSANASTTEDAKRQRLYQLHQTVQMRTPVQTSSQQSISRRPLSTKQH